MRNYPDGYESNREKMIKFIRDFLLLLLVAAIAIGVVSIFLIIGDAIVDAFFFTSAVPAIVRLI